MAFEKGRKKTGGRKKGVGNKKTFDAVTWSEMEVEELKKLVMSLAKDKNPSLLTAVFRSMVAPRVPEQEANEDQTIPEIVINVIPNKAGENNL